MERQTSVNNSSARPIKDAVWFCSACGKANVRSARFCGGCGRTPLQAVKEATASNSCPIGDTDDPPEMASEALAVVAGKVAAESGGRHSIDFAITQRRFVALIEYAANFFQAQLRKRLHKKFNGERARKMVVLIAGSVLLGSAIWLAGSMKSPYAVVKWGEFRSFVTKKLVVSPSELDIIFSGISLARVDAKASINVVQVAKLEGALRQKLADSSLRLFPNPFFGSAGEFLGGFVFADVPLDHPVYRALQPLLELGIQLADSRLCIKPYERMAWADWQRVVGDLTGALGIDKKGLPTNRSGYMGDEDLKSYLAHLGLKLAVGGVERGGNFAGGQPLSRIEAFAALAGMIGELAGHG